MTSTHSDRTHNKYTWLKCVQKQEGNLGEFNALSYDSKPPVAVHFLLINLFESGR